MTFKKSVLSVLIVVPLVVDVVSANVSVSLTVSKNEVAKGESVSLSWAAPGATSCTPSWTNQTSTAFGSGISKALTTNTRFTVTCIDSQGKKSATSTVVTVPSLMNISLTASSTSLQKGESAILTWKSEHASRCTSSWSTYSIDTTGTYTTDPLIAPTTFSVKCISSDGVAESKSVKIMIAPLVIALTASPSSVSEGSTTTITLSTVGASYCTPSWNVYTRGVSAVFITPPLFTTTAYTVTCGSVDGQLASKRVTITTKKPSKQTAPVVQTSSKATSTLPKTAHQTTPPVKSNPQPIVPQPVSVSQKNNSPITLSATPREIASGGTTTLKYTSIAKVFCTPSWNTAFRSTSSSWVTPRLTGDVTYTVTCYDNKNNASHAEVHIKVAQPTLSLSVSNHLVKKGSPITISWQAEGLVSCASSWQATPVPLSGIDVVEKVLSSHLYTLVCKTPNGVELKRYEYVLAY